MHNLLSCFCCCSFGFYISVLDENLFIIGAILFALHSSLISVKKQYLLDLKVECETHIFLLKDHINNEIKKSTTQPRSHGNSMQHSSTKDAITLDTQNQHTNFAEQEVTNGKGTLVPDMKHNFFYQTLDPILQYMYNIPTSVTYLIQPNNLLPQAN